MKRALPTLGLAVCLFSGGLCVGLVVGRDERPRPIVVQAAPRQQEGAAWGEVSRLLQVNAELRRELAARVGR